MPTMKQLNEISQLEYNYKKCFGEFPEVAHPDVPDADYANMIRESIESGKPINTSLDPKS